MLTAILVNEPFFSIFVIFADSFSKCVAPGLRVGYVYADAETIYRIYGSIYNETNIIRS